ncbi:MAG: hypothetical protein MJ223_02555 [Mycoplasmoidaceae bacterium]|nr:hypothetical protein [Mycoplasmoidaceae bacterium]
MFTIDICVPFKPVPTSSIAIIDTRNNCNPKKEQQLTINHLLNCLFFAVRDTDSIKPTCFWSFNLTM